MEFVQEPHALPGIFVAYSRVILPGEQDQHLPQDSVYTSINQLEVILITFFQNKAPVSVELRAY